jgi:hypothetical protein
LEPLPELTLPKLGENPLAVNRPSPPLEDSQIFGGGTAGGGGKLPLQVLSLGAGSYILTQGTVNGQYPDEVASGAYTFTASAGDYIWAKVTYFSGTIQISDISIDNGSPIPANTSDIGYVAIAALDGSGNVSPNGGNLTFDPCSLP